MTFDELCTLLKLENSDQLEPLRQWCLDNVASEVDYTGSPDDQLDEYLALAQDYLDNFLPNANNSKPVISLNHLTGLQYAAANGYDHYLCHLDGLTPAQVNHETHSGMTPLHLAAAGGHANVVDFLLKHGADTRKVSKSGKSPLISALLLPALHEKSLIDNKENIFRRIWKASHGLLEKQDDHGDTVFHHMAAHPYATLLAETMKENPNGVFLPNNDGNYPVHIAILNRQPEIVDLLMQVPDMHSVTDSSHRTPLTLAEEHGYQDLVDILREHGASNGMRSNLS